AVFCLFELPVQTVIVAEVLPAVAVSDVAARGFQKARTDTERKTGAALPAHEHIFSRGLVTPYGIAGAAAFEMWREKNVHLQPLAPFISRVDSRMHEHARSRGIGNDLLHDPVAACRVACDDAITERFRLQTFDFVYEMAFLFVKESLVVSHQ